jgi:hypothetical protein
MEAYLQSSSGSRWSLMGALLGMYANASVRRPEELQEPADHQILFDRALLTDVLTQSGFVSIRDLTDVERDRHSDGWRDLVPQISLVFEARKPALAQELAR